jgi:hypothetical protein
VAVAVVTERLPVERQQVVVEMVQGVVLILDLMAQSILAVVAAAVVLQLTEEQVVAALSSSNTPTRLRQHSLPV